MKKLTQEQINKILEEHKHWLNEDCEGWETMKANFSCCNLGVANLCYIDLRGANLGDANLGDAKKVPYIPMVCPEDVQEEYISLLIDRKQSITDVGGQNDKRRM